MTKRLSYKEFVEKARKVHGNKYNYSKVDYASSKKPVVIICTEHGEFLQTPTKHLSGHGCPKCAKTGVKCDENIFKNKLKILYGDAIRLSPDSHYINSHAKIEFICKNHGVFKQRPNDILNGHSCPICGYNIIKKKLKMTNDDFIKKANRIHQGKYDYTNVQYVSYNTPVKIICHIKDKNGKEHGQFLQSPHIHLTGCGCPKCKMSNLEETISCLLDLNGIKYVYQKHFPWLKLQSLDFYLPDYKVGIECQGNQHYKPTNFGSTNKNAIEMFSYITENDRKKKILCNKNNVKLLYFAKNIPQNYNKENIYTNKKKLINDIINDK